MHTPELQLGELGHLRKWLADNLGPGGSRVALTQFGFAHGWRLAEAMDAKLEWDCMDDWREACTRLNALEGRFCLEAAGSAATEGIALSASHEAEQHVLHCGVSDVPVCWTICGLVSGYLSRSTGKEIYVIEDRCIGRGDAACHLVGCTREEWGDKHAEDLRAFEFTRRKDCLDVSLAPTPDCARAEVDAEPQGIVAKSAPMRQVVKFARKLAGVNATVLVTGESGAGKERIARLVHEESARASGPFIAVNCGAIAETLLESELFGHVRGAFTGATHDRPGLFEAAHGGTLLLDEVGELSPGMQVKLLRVLQEREVRRVGENKSRRVDVRVVAATNRNLALAVASATFRQDLYYRLKVVELHVPPLRDRRDDVLPLAHALFTAAALRMERTISGLSPSVADQLLRYDWPGNVRELENAMERAVALAPGSRIELEDLPDEVRPAPSAPAPAPVPPAVPERRPVRPLDDIEKEAILAALDVNGGNQTQTAIQLGIGTATLYRKLRSWGMLERKAPRDATPALAGA